MNLIRRLISGRLQSSSAVCHAGAIALLSMVFVGGATAHADDFASAPASATATSIDWHLLFVQTLQYAEVLVPLTAVISVAVTLFVLPRLIKHWTRDYRPFSLKAFGFGDPVSFAAERMSIRVNGEIRPVDILAVGYSARRGDRAASQTDNGFVQLIDCRTHQIVGRLEMPEFVSPTLMALAKHPTKTGEGFLAVSAGVVGNTCVYVYSISELVQSPRARLHDTRFILHRDHYYQPSALAIGPAGTLAVADVEGTVTLYELMSPIPTATQLEYSHPGDEAVRSVCFQPHPPNSTQNRTVVSASQNSIQWFDLGTRSKVQIHSSISGSNLKLQQVAFSPKGDALAILSTSPDNAGEIRLIVKQKGTGGREDTERVLTWKATGADQVIFNGPEWDAVITRDRPSTQTSGGRIWNVPAARDMAPREAVPLTGTPDRGKYIYYIYPGQFVLFVDAKGRVIYRPEREVDGKSADAPVEETPLYVIPDINPASSSSDSGAHDSGHARAHAHHPRYEPVVSKGQVAAILGAIALSVLTSFAAAWVSVASPAGQARVAEAYTRTYLLQDVLTQARASRMSAIDFARQAKKARDSKLKRSCQAKAKQQWAKVDREVSRYDTELARWSQEARMQNIALHTKPGVGPHDRLDSVSEVMLLEAEANNEQGITDDAETIVNQIYSDFDRARVPSEPGGPSISIQSAVQKRLPAIAKSLAKTAAKPHVSSKAGKHTKAANPRKAPRRRTTGAAN